jgi:CheY-like chemotaxis protein
MKSEPKHVLVVEDQSAERNVVAFNLEKAGFKVTLAGDGVNALRLAQDGHFDLVITDYFMPYCTGAEFVAKLRAVDAYAGTPVIFLTGKAKELNLQYLRDDLGARVVSKPCSMVRLVEMVSEALAVASGDQKLKAVPM